MFLFIVYIRNGLDMEVKNVGVSDFGSGRNIRTKSAILMVSG